MTNLYGDLELAEVEEIEQVALRAWPGLEIVAEGGWLLRYAGGVTRRANSVWPNMPGGGCELDERLAKVEEFYLEQGLPARFQICPVAQPAHLDDYLEQRGYAAVARTAVQTTDLATMVRLLGEFPTFRVEVTEKGSAEWWACYAAADDVAVESLAGRQRICSAIEQTTAFATVFHNAKPIAVGSAAVEARWIGLFNVATLSEYRRMGAARALLSALARWGQGQGATRAYLQVMADNRVALQLYARLNFSTGYYYHYRERVQSTKSERR